MLVTFLTHGGGNIGGGHLSRCLALSQALEERDVNCQWFVNPQAWSYLVNLNARNVYSTDRLFQIDPARLVVHSDVVVIDSYEPEAAYYRQTAAFAPVVAIDDMAERGLENFASILINYSIGATPKIYCSSRCRYLIGPKYALLRKDFWFLQPDMSDYILFIPGAADVVNASAEIAAMWRDQWPLLKIVQGAFVPEETRRSAMLVAKSKNNVKILTAPENFPQLLANAQTIICTASVTAYEALSLKKRVAVFTVADNQRGLPEALQKEPNLACYMGNWSEVDDVKISEALAFSPNLKTLRNAVNPKGALVCAEELLRIIEGR